MRTTVTLDDDVARMLHDAMHASQRSFKETLNAAVRAGLSQSASAVPRKRFVVEGQVMGLRSGVDPASFNQLLDEMDIEAFRERQG